MNTNLQEDDWDWILDDDEENDYEDLEMDKFDNIDPYAVYGFIEENLPVIDSGIKLVEKYFDIPESITQLSFSVIHKIPEIIDKFFT